MAAPIFGEMNTSNETPLMFSRSSSLGSLSSLEQQVPSEDHGYNASDFSRQTSGAISPSDLPDSPSQTMPPSPKRFSRRPAFRLPPCIKPLPQPVGGVFQDAPRSFAEEGTPCGISQATSLSSLAVDDEPRNARDTACDTSSRGSFHNKEGQQHTSRGQGDTATSVGGEVFADTTRRYAQEGTPRGYSRAESLSSLAADSSCLQSGMGSDWEDDFEVRPTGCSDRNSALSNSRATYGCSGAEGSLKPQGTHKHVSFNDDCQMRTSHEDTAVPYFAEDCVRVYCTEDTPSMLSHATSLTDLSVSKDWEALPEQNKAGDPPDNQQKCPLGVATGTKAQGCHKHVSFRDDCLLSPSSSDAAPHSFEQDCVRVYCTEDTPSMLSHSASLADLSVPNGDASWTPVKESALPASSEVDLSANISDDEASEDILAECIQLGWQAVKAENPSLQVGGWIGVPENAVLAKRVVTIPSATGAIRDPSHLDVSTSKQDVSSNCVSASTWHFKGILDVRSLSSSDLAGQGSLEPTLHLKSSSLSDVNDLSKQSKSPKVVRPLKGLAPVGDCRPSEPDVWHPKACRPDEDINEKQCPESSDEEDDTKFLQEVVRMGRELVTKQDTLVALAKSKNDTPSGVFAPSQLTSSTPVSAVTAFKSPDVLSGVGDILTCSPSAIQWTATTAVIMSSQGNLEHEHLKENELCLGSSDEEEDGKLLQEVINLGRAVTSEQRRNNQGDAATVELSTSHPAIHYSAPDTPGIAGHPSRGCEAFQLDTDAMNRNKVVNESPEEPECRVPNLENSLSDDEDNSRRILEEVVMLGRLGNSNLSPKLPDVQRVADQKNDCSREISKIVHPPDKATSTYPTALEGLSAAKASLVPKDAALDHKLEKKFQVPPEPPMDSPDRVVLIRLKLPAGRTITRRFLATWELGALLAFLESLGYPLKKYKILKNWRDRKSVV